MNERGTPAATRSEFIYTFSSSMRQRNHGELKRLASFAAWPSASGGHSLFPSYTTSAIVLALSGFQYTGRDDAVICPMCGIEIDGWLRPDSNLSDPYLEHRRRSPFCSLARECSTSREQTSNKPASSTLPNATLVPSVSDEVALSTSTSFRNGASLSENGCVSMLTSSQSQRKCESAKASGGVTNGFNLSEERHQSESSHELSLTSSVARSAELVRIDRSRPDYSQIKKERVRLGTFNDWPSTAPVKPVELAADGWFYTGQADRTRCAFCRRVLHNWAKNDRPAEEHRRHYPDCPFVQGRDVGNIPIVAGERQEPSVSSVSSAPVLVVPTTAAASASATVTVKSKSQDDKLTNGDSGKAMGRNGSTEQNGASAAAAGDWHKTTEGASSLIYAEEEQRLLQENQRLVETRTCKVCMDHEVNTVFLPCGHLVSCNECAPKLRNCPICRTYIRGTVKTALS